MMATLELIICLIVLPTYTHGKAMNFETGEPAPIRWARNCDFHDHDWDKKVGSAHECGQFCRQSQKCTHFSYMKDTCYLKSGPVHLDHAINRKENVLCGVDCSKVEAKC